MQKGTPKTYLSTSRTVTALTCSPLHYDMDLKYQEQYLSKLKTQRLKTQKLHSQYKKLLKNRDKIKEQYLQLQYKYDELKRREEKLGGQTSIELLKIKNRVEQLQRQNMRLKGEQQDYNNNKWVYEKQVEQLEHEVKIALHEDEYRQLRTEELEEENRQLESMIAKYQRQIGQLDNQVAENESKCKQLMKDLTAAKDEHSRSKAAWETEREQLKQAQYAKTDQIRVLKHQLEEHRSHNDHHYQVQIQELQLSFSIKLDQKTKEVSSLRKNLDAMRDQNKKLKVQLQTSRRQHDNLHNSIKVSLEQLTLKLASKQSECFDIQKKYVSALEQIKQMEARIRELEVNLRKSEDSCRRKQQNCEEYLKIISKMELVQQRRKVIVESEYDQLLKMERIFRQ